jgi:hypothetical protein
MNLKNRKENTKGKGKLVICLRLGRKPTGQPTYSRCWPNLLLPAPGPRMVFLSARPSREDRTHQRCCAADRWAQPGGHLVVLPHVSHVAHLLTTSASWAMHAGCAGQLLDPDICGYRPFCVPSIHTTQNPSQFCPMWEKSTSRTHQCGAWTSRHHQFVQTSSLGPW